MPPSAEVVFNYVHHRFPDHEISVAFEIGCCGFWAAREMLGFGWKVLVVNPGDVKQSDKHRYQKTDRIDSHHYADNFKKKNSMASTFILKNKSNFATCFASVITYPGCYANKIPD